MVALSAKTVFSLQHALSQRSVSGVIGQFNPFMVDKDPQSRFEFRDIGTGLVRFSCFNIS